MTGFSYFIFELIDMRSFSSLWYWIALAVMWSSVSYWVLGVPWDMVTRARRHQYTKDIEDLENLVRINCDRIEFIVNKSGLFMAGFAFFLLTMLSLLGFWYGNEFSQAVFFIILPMCIVVFMSIKASRKIRTQSLQGPALYKKMYVHRLSLQMLGVLCIFITAMWGMYQNLTTHTFGIF